MVTQSVAVIVKREREMQEGMECGWIIRENDHLEFKPSLSSFLPRSLPFLLSFLSILGVREQEEEI